MAEEDAKNGNGYRIPPWAQQLIYFAGFITALILSYASLQSDLRSTTERLDRFETDLSETPSTEVINLELSAIRKDAESAINMCREAPRADVLEARLQGIDEKIQGLIDEVTLQRMNNKAFREHLLSKGVLRDAP